MFDKRIGFPVIPGFMINFNYKHKNIKNSLFFPTSEALSNQIIYGAKYHGFAYLLRG